MVTAVIEPFGFFTSDALRAGWYLTWRLFVRIVPAILVVGILGFALGQGSSIGAMLVIALGALAVGIWALVLVPKLTSQWTLERYGAPLANHLQVWWGITWRSLVVSLVAAVIMAVPNVIAVSFQTAYGDSMLGLVGGLMIFVLSVGNFAVSVLATGWAMSRVAVAQLGGVAPVAPTPAPVRQPAAPVRQPMARSEPVAVPEDAFEPGPEPVTARPAVPPVSVSAPPVAPEGKLMCPKCGLYETELGSVIGWYCKVCGWREARR